MLGSDYRYSPVSPLYVAGRSQDFALQKCGRRSTNGCTCGCGSRRCGSRASRSGSARSAGTSACGSRCKTWNLTTHKIDPDVDDARDYVLDDLMEARPGRRRWVTWRAWGPPAHAAPRHNLTGDPYFTDGLRAVAIFSETRTSPTFLNWA